MAASQNAPPYMTRHGSGAYRTLPGGTFVQVFSNIYPNVLVLAKAEHLLVPERKTEQMVFCPEKPNK